MAASQNPGGGQKAWLPGQPGQLLPNLHQAGFWATICLTKGGMVGRFGGGGPGPPVAESAEVYRPDGEGPAATTGTHTNVKSSLLNTNVKSKINRTKK